MTEHPRGEVAHLGHAELLTPVPDLSLAYFTELLGMTVVDEAPGAWFLRGHGDYERYSLKLTAAAAAGLGHMALRARSAAALQRRVSWLKSAGVDGVLGITGGGQGARVRVPRSRRAFVPSLLRDREVRGAC